MTAAIGRPRLRVRTILVLVAAIAVLLAAWEEFGNPVRRWRRALREDNDSVRRWHALYQGVSGKVAGVDAGVAVVELRAALDDPSFRVRETACVGLAQFRAVAEPAVPALAVVLQNDRDITVRAAAAKAMAGILETSRASQGRGVAVPALIRALNDRSPHVRFEAAIALVRLDEGEPAVSVLIEGLRRPDVMTYGEACWALGKLGQKAGPAIPALLAFVGDFDPRSAAQFHEVYRRQALGILIGLGRQDDVRRTLERAGNSPDPSVRRAARDLRWQYLDDIE